MKRTPLKRHMPLRAKTGFLQKYPERSNSHPKIRLIATTKQLRRRSKTPLAKTKQKLWELCKQIIRERYGNTCYTCYKQGLEGSNWHTGHFITDSICSTELSYDLRNLRPQCYHCNINLSGNWVAFESRLVLDCGAAYVNELKRRNQATKGKKYDILWYERKVKEYQALKKPPHSATAF